jgi:hypothetical protein
MEQSPGSEYEVFQDVLILFVDVAGGEISVDLYGSAEGICGSVTYELSDDETCTRRLATLRQWCDELKPVTYVRRGDVVALLDEGALLHEALGEIEPA